MASAEHVSEWGQDEDGWPTVMCSCGWGDGMVFPGTEDAADAWGDHMYDVGRSVERARAAAEAGEVLDLAARKAAES